MATLDQIISPGGPSGRGGPWSGPSL